MAAERHFALPETVDETTPEVIAQCAEEFEAHLTRLESERACSSILATFRQHPNLVALSFSVRHSADDEAGSSLHRKTGILDVDPSFSALCGEDTWDESTTICSVLNRTMTVRLSDFYDGLRLRREELLKANDADIFETPRAMRIWLEYDLK